jgi:hypothetical protein
MRVGHFTFALSGLVLALAYFTLRVILAKARWQDYLGSLLIGWCFFSGGFYHAFVFLYVPVFAILAVLTLLRSAGAGSVKAALSIILRTGTPVTLSMAPALYKIIPVLEFQSELPRSHGINLALNFSWVYILLGLFLPSGHHNFRGEGVLQEVFNLTLRQGGIWEVAFFSTAPWLILGALGILLYLRYTKASLELGWKWPAYALSAGLIVFSALLALGDFGSFAPFALLNKVAGQGIRIPIRFSLALLLGLVLLLALLLRSIDCFKGKSIMLWVSNVALLGNCLVFFAHEKTSFPGPQLRAQPLLKPRFLRSAAVFSCTN